MKEETRGEAGPIDEEVESDELEARPEDFLACNVCQKALSQDEKIINARFVNEAMAAGIVPELHGGLHRRRLTSTCAFVVASAP